MKEATFLVKSLLSNIETYLFTITSILFINSFITSMLISWSSLELLPTLSSTPITKLSNQIVWVLHLVSKVFLLRPPPPYSLTPRSEERRVRL